MPSFDLTNLVPGKKYAVMVRSIDADGNYSNNSLIYTFTTPKTTLSGTQLTSVNSTVVTAIAKEAGSAVGAALTAGALDTNGVSNSGSIDLSTIWNNTKNGYTTISSLTGTASAGAVIINSTGILGYSFASVNPGITSSGQAQFFLSNVDGNAYFRGTVYAGAGQIGGFTIGASSLYAGSSGSITGLIPGSSAAFFAGATGNDGSGAKFRVTNDGNIYSTSGLIGGFTITSTAFSSSFTENYLGASYSPLFNVPASNFWGASIYIVGAGNNTASVGTNGTSTIAGNYTASYNYLLITKGSGGGSVVGVKAIFYSVASSSTRFSSSTLKLINGQTYTFSIYAQSLTTAITGASVVIRKYDAATGGNLLQTLYTPYSLSTSSFTRMSVPFTASNDYLEISLENDNNITISGGVGAPFTVFNFAAPMISDSYPAAPFSPNYTQGINIRTQPDSFSSSKINLLETTVNGVNQTTIDDSGKLFIQGSPVKAQTSGIGVTGAGGNVRIVHGLGTTPAAVQVTLLATASTNLGRTFGVTNITSTDFWVFSNNTSGTYITSSFSWTAIAP